MSDASAMVERCGRHQHPEWWGGVAVVTTCSAGVARAIAAMSCDRGPVEAAVGEVVAAVARRRRQDAGAEGWD